MVVPWHNSFFIFISLLCDFHWSFYSPLKSFSGHLPLWFLCSKWLTYDAIFSPLTTVIFYSENFETTLSNHSNFKSFWHVWGVKKYTHTSKIISNNEWSGNGVLVKNKNLRVGSVYKLTSLPSTTTVLSMNN